jgi:hypothetical protein
VLRTTSTTILEGHLTWLVARTQGKDHLSSQRILLEDQARILIDVLEAGGDYDTITRALDTPWLAADVPDGDGDVSTYASLLDTATAGQPEYSPYVALARSATKFTAEILDHRGSSTSRRPSG